MRIATWNVNSLRVRWPHLENWFKTAPVDVLALQETKLIDSDFPQDSCTAIGLNAIFCGQKTYNGVALLSKQPLTDVVAGMPAYSDEQKRVLAATVNGVRVVNVYVPNGQTLDSEKFAYKLTWLQALHDYLRDELTRHPQLVLLGDFNIAPEDRDVHDPKAWEGSVHVSEPERQALQSLLSLGLVDVFRKFEQAEKTFSWWDYRMMAFRRNNGLRIDLILASTALAERCIGCHIDKEPRRLERPSDHTPVVADFDVAI